MVSKSQMKLISGLAQKKYRQRHGLFVVEGLKGIQELLESPFKLKYLYSLAESAAKFDVQKVEIVNLRELQKMSTLKNPQEALAIFEIPKEASHSPAAHGLTLMLDDVRDPGNLGTLIRLCDWFGIERLVCSRNTVDCYNPKVVQASMGSLGRVEVIYSALADYLNENKLPVYGAFMDGKDVYGEDLPSDAVLILGNEANGISESCAAFVDHKITIPHYGLKTAESLNVATAGAIMMSTWRGRG